MQGRRPFLFSLIKLIEEIALIFLVSSSVIGTNMHSKHGSERLQSARRQMLMFFPVFYLPSCPPRQIELSAAG